MKRLITLTLLMSLSLTAGPVMKITLNGSVSDESLASLSKIVFSETEMIAGSSYSLQEIEKIEFYDDGGAVSIASTTPQTTNSTQQISKIGFASSENSITLSLPKAAHVTASLYSINGRKVTVLYSGSAQQGVLSMPIEKSSLAAGIYSLVVKADNAVFVKKMMVK